MMYEDYVSVGETFLEREGCSLSFHFTLFIIQFFQATQTVLRLSAICERIL